jgi:hypothetical protein
MPQDMLGSPDLLVEVYHVMAFLLTYCTEGWESRSAARQTDSPLRRLLGELLAFVGFFCVLRPVHQVRLAPMASATETIEATSVCLGRSV